MSILVVDETARCLKITVQYDTTAGATWTIQKHLYDHDAQLRKTAIALRWLAGRIDTWDSKRHEEVMKGLHD